jgi:hypothetical protein
MVARMRVVVQPETEEARQARFAEAQRLRTLVQQEAYHGFDLMYALAEATDAERAVVEAIMLRSAELHAKG